MLLPSCLYVPTLHSISLVCTIQTKQLYFIRSQVFERAPEDPSISQDHSILKHADDIKGQSEGECFQYRLEASASGQNGGIWRASKSYSFVARNNSQTDVELLTKFGNWEHGELSLEKRMPWVCEENYCFGILTTSEHKDKYFGSIISGSLYDGNWGLPAPWFGNDKNWPGIIWYWMREGMLKLQTYYIRYYESNQFYYYQRLHFLGNGVGKLSENFVIFLYALRFF